MNLYARSTTIALFAISAGYWSLTSARADLLVGSNRTDSVLRFNQCSGELIDEFISQGSGGLSRPGGIALGADGDLYVSSNATTAFFATAEPTDPSSTNSSQPGQAVSTSLPL